MGNFVDKVIDSNNNEAQIKHSYLNDSGNLEISNENIPGAESDSKVNIVSKTDIQIKPGDKSDIQLDCEKNITNGDPVELGIKVSNGSYEKSKRVVGVKLNTAEITIDNQKAHTTKVGSEDTFDIDKIRINFRTDKWKPSGSDVPTRNNNVGPVDVKFRGKSFDIRCHGTAPGGGIALLPSGTDPDGYENKIKFESSRISELGTVNPEYSTEGGMGLEFGTFNNEHTSLFTTDYRFNKNGIVYAATRDPIQEESSGKIDYPTQEDDFKDIISNKECTTWADIIAAGNERITVISKSGNLKSYLGTIVNNMHIPVYVGPDGKLYLSEGDLDVVYDANDNLVQFDEEHWTQDAVVYIDNPHTTPVDASSKLFLKDTIKNEYWIADIKSDSKLRAYSSTKHDKVVNMEVVSAATVSGSGYTEILPGKFYETINDDPIMAAIKNIIEDSSIESYADFRSAMMSAFGWTPTT